MTTSTAAWLPDPSGRHQYRYWTGEGWSDQVADNGQQSTDALADSLPSLEVSQPSPASRASEQKPAVIRKQSPVAAGEVTDLLREKVSAASQIVETGAAHAEQYRQQVTSALERFQKSTAGLSGFFKRAALFGLTVPVLWIVGLAIAGWLTSPGGLVLIVLGTGVWLAASFGTLNLSWTLGAMSTSFQQVIDRIGSLGGASSEVQALAQAMGENSSLSSGHVSSALELRKHYKTVRTGLGTVANLRSINVAVYGYGIASFAVLIMVCCLGLLFTTVAILF